MGWQVSPPLNDPLDVGISEEDWELVGYPRRSRKEILCWIRGGRYVRVCEVQIVDEEKDYQYALHHGLLDEEGSDQIYQRSDNLKVILFTARTLMRIGGYPT